RGGTGGRARVRITLWPGGRRRRDGRCGGDPDRVPRVEGRADGGRGGGVPVAGAGADRRTGGRAGCARVRSGSVRARAGPVSVRARSPRVRPPAVGSGGAVRPAVRLRGSRLRCASPGSVPSGCEGVRPLRPRGPSTGQVPVEVRPRVRGHAVFPVLPLRFDRRPAAARFPVLRRAAACAAPLLLPVLPASVGVTVAGGRRVVAGRRGRPRDRGAVALIAAAPRSPVLPAVRPPGPKRAGSGCRSRSASGRSDARGPSAG